MLSSLSFDLQHEHAPMIIGLHSPCDLLEPDSVAPLTEVVVAHKQQVSSHLNSEEIVWCVMQKWMGWNRNPFLLVMCNAAYA